MRKSRILELDGLRTIAVSLVVVAHLFGPLTFRGKVLVAPLLNLGWAGVDLFFVLSGYLVCSIVIANRYSANLFPVFFLRRVLRILPLYYVALLLGMLAASLFPGEAAIRTPWWVFFVHGQPIWFAIVGVWTYPFLNVTWSLGIEEYFYLLAPWMLVFVNRQSLRRACVMVLVLLPFLRLWIYSRDPLNHLFSTILRPDGLILGAWLALTLSDESLRDFWFARAKVLKGVWLILALVFVGYPFLPMGHIARITFLYSWTVLFFGVTVLLLLSPESLLRVRKLLCGRLMVVGGQSSYGTYLLHPLVMTFVMGATGSYSVFTAMACWGVTCILSAASWQAWESHLVAFGHRFSYAPSRALTPQSAP